MKYRAGRGGTVVPGAPGSDPAAELRELAGGLGVWLRRAGPRVPSGLAGAGEGRAVPSLEEARTLEEVREVLGDCRRCRLHQGRSRIVFGQGDPQARLVLVGEGPGEEEDRQGLAFVGPAGQLLTRILTAIGLRRGQVYITNIVKCRPPGNRDPQEDEVAACLPFLRRQLAIIRPDLICTLGAPASRTLLETRAPISRLRGRFHRMGEMRVLPTYHPAYLLRNPSEKRAVWEDMQLLQRAYREPGTMGERS